MKKFVAILFAVVMVCSTALPAAISASAVDTSSLAGTTINVYNWGIIAGIGMYLHLKKCELPIRIRYCYGNKVDMATLTIGYTFKLK